MSSSGVLPTNSQECLNGAKSNTNNADDKAKRKSSNAGGSDKMLYSNQV